MHLCIRYNIEYRWKYWPLAEAGFRRPSAARRTRWRKTWAVEAQQPRMGVSDTAGIRNICIGYLHLARFTEKESSG